MKGLICPNTNSPEFKELASAVGENIAFDIWDQNNGNPLDRAPNGEPSELFGSLIVHFNGNRVEAIKAKAKVYSKSFKAWFGDWLSEDKTDVSKVVDKNGEPLVVHHGTRRHGFDFFDKSRLGNNTGASSAKLGFFFAEDYETAEGYFKHKHTHDEFDDGYLMAQELDNVSIEIQEILERIDNLHKDLDFLTTTVFEDEFSRISSINDSEHIREEIESFDTTLGELLKKYSELDEKYKNFKNNPGGVYDVYLSVKDPIIYDFENDYNRRISYYKLLKRGQDDKKDGASFLNTFDGSNATNIHVTFDANQIKSVENKGSFSKQDNVIYNFEGRIHELQDKFPASIFVKNGINTLADGLKLVLNNTDSKLLKSVSEMLLKLIENKKLPDIDVRYMRFEAHGMYKADYSTGFSGARIYLNENSLRSMTTDSSLRVFVHEAVHHFTSAAIHGNLEFNIRLNRLFKQYVKVAKDNGFDYTTDYATNSPSDFLSELLSSDHVYRNLQEVGNKTAMTLWDRIVEFLRSVWGSIFTDSQQEANDLVAFLVDFWESGEALNVEKRLADTRTWLIEEYFSQGAKDRTKLITQKAQIINDRIKNGLKDRIKALESRSVVDPAYKREIRNLRDNLDKLEDRDAMIGFLRYLREDLETPYNYISDAFLKKQRISPTQLIQFKQDYMGFYQPMLSDIASLFNTTYFIDFPIEVQKDIRKLIGETQSRFSEINGMYGQLVAEEFVRTLGRIGLDAGSPTIQEYLEKNTFEIDSDISWFETYLGSLNNANDEALRAVYYEVSKVKNAIERTTYEHGKKLAALAAKTSDHLQLFERDSDGKKTGYIIRKRNYGQFHNDRKDFQAGLMTKYNLESCDDVPTDNAAFQAYNQEKNTWLSKFAERPYTPEYYELFAGLSYDTAMAREDLQMSINKILNTAKIEDGDLDLSKLSQSTFDQLSVLYRRKRELSSDYTLDGQLKEGRELEMARELAAVNEKLAENLKSKKNMAKFEEARRKAKARLTKDQFQMWEYRNLQVRYTDDFYALFDRMAEREELFDTSELLKERQDILRLFRNTHNPQIGAANMSPEARERIKLLDEIIRDINEEIYREMGVAHTDSGEGLKFSDFATKEFSDDYKAELMKAIEADKVRPGALTEWQADNHYTVKLGKKSRTVPYSYWLYTKPIEELESKYTEIVPNNMWQEVDTSSPYYNDNYDRTDPQYIQPKKKYYDNEKAYNEMRANKPLSDLYDGIVASMTESNSKITFRQHIDSYKLPQISGTAYQHIRSGDNVIKGLFRYVKDNVVVRDDDIEFNNNVVKRPNGSKLYVVPTHYMKMLDNPEALTNDIAGATISYFRMAENFKQMNKLAPTIELLQEQLATRKYNRGKKFYSRRGETIEGTETNTYKALDQFKKMHIYGERKQNLEVQIKNARFSATKILGLLRNYAQAVNLSWNITAMEVGALTGMHHALLEAITDRYYSMSDFAKGHGTMMKSLLNVISNWGNYNSNNLVLALMEMNQVARSNDEIFGKLNQTRAGRFITNHFWYGGYSGGDFMVKGSIMLAIYNNTKLVTDPETKEKKFMGKREFLSTYYRDNEARGKEIWKTFKESLYNAYTVEGGVAKVKPEYQKYVTTKVMDDVANTAKNFSARADGVLNELDRAYIHANAFTQFIFMHRNFLVVNIQDRLTKKYGFNYQTGQMDEAMYISLGRNLIEWFKQLYQNLVILHKYEIPAWGKNQSDRDIVKRVAIEVAMLLAYWGISQLWDDAADDDDAKWLTQHIAYMVKRHYFEIHAQYDPSDIVNIIKSPTAAMSTINQLSLLLSPFSAIWGALGGDTELNREVTRGPYSKLDEYASFLPSKTYRWQQAMVKATPFKHLIEMRDPNLKRKYLENMVIK